MMRLFAPLAPLLAVGALPQGEVADPPDPYVQTQTGMAYPAHVGAAVRHHVVRYNDSGSDTSASYQLIRDGHMVAYVTVFVYPAPDVEPGEAARAAMCRRLSDQQVADVQEGEPDAKVVAQGDIAAPSALFKPKGQTVTLTGGRSRTKFYGAEKDVRERADLFCFPGGRWAVAYRVTTPIGVDATAEVDAFMRALPWPAALAG